MNDKNLQEAKDLNAKARANQTASGASKVSMTSGTTTPNMTSSTNSADLQETKQLNQQSRNKKGTPIK